MPGTRFYSSKAKQNQIFISPYALQYGARFEVQQLWHLSLRKETKRALNT